MAAVPKPIAEAALAVQANQRRNAQFYIRKFSDDDALVDELLQHIAAMLRPIMANFVAGDDAENGRILARAIQQYGDEIDRQHPEERYR